MFAKPKEAEPNYGGGGGDESDGTGKGGDSPPAFADDNEPPTVALGGSVSAQKSPFTKTFERLVEKFKIAVPIELKKNCGNGKVSI